ncbi:DUF3105 domain-containing protein [Actinacidiphila bryophytorum]|uniref:DUF3105 domain-containing protein n=1 Tax=Actinacidiphila bryophytorum TaxID=1436133 RepID=UPI002176C6A4|nr:DUF3105 domain-containing protein [Actinacidiphila bryophytorum]UWE13633.1 DUF3105 domain-containing protein [Actinacidiphila bryophytorum]
MVDKVGAQRRRERAAQARAQARQKERRRRLVRYGLITASALVAAGGLTAAALAAGGGSSTAKIDGVRSFGHLSRNHVQGTVSYAQNPPVGGDHSPVWLNCGIYDKPVPNENAVHDMEHGAVWITYRPGLPADQLAELKATAGKTTFVGLSPYPGLTSPIVISAWGKQLVLQKADDPRLADFVSAYRQGPQTPEPGAPCTGGIGTPDK